MASNLIPHEVVSAVVSGATPIQAWREYLGLSLDETASRLGMDLKTYSDIESQRANCPLYDVAAALGIKVEQLDF